VYLVNGIGYIYPPDNTSKKLFVKFDSLIQTTYYVNGEHCKDSEINTDSRFKSYTSKALNKQSLEDFVDNNRFSLSLNQYAYN